MSEYIMQCTTDMDGIDCYVHTGVLIRCKDCRYYKTYQYVNGRPKFLPKCGFNNIYVTEEDFCSRAERIQE